MKLPQIIKDRKNVQQKNQILLKKGTYCPSLLVREMRSYEIICILFTSIYCNYSNAYLAQSFFAVGIITLELEQFLDGLTC